MASTGAAATKEPDPPSAQYSSTDVWSSPTYEQIRLQDRTASEQNRDFQECLIDLVGPTPLASPVSTGGLSITMDMISPIPPYPASPQWDPETVEQMSDPVHRIPFSPTIGNQTAYSTNSAAAPAIQGDTPPSQRPQALRAMSIQSGQGPKCQRLAAASVGIRASTPW